MLTATGTIVFLLVASALVSLAIHTVYADAGKKRSDAVSHSLRTARADSARMLELERTVAAMQIPMPIPVQPEADSRVPLLEHQLKRVGQKLVEVDARLEGIDANCATLMAAGSDNEQLDRIQKSLYAQDMRLCTLEENLQNTVARVGDIEVSAAARGEAARAAAAAASEAEAHDLTRIKGIGAVLAKTLNDAGITTIDQVASLDINQIEELSERLGKFGDRVERDRWVEQAQALVS